LAAGSAVFIFALGLTVLAGWFSHAPALVQFLPQLPAMTRNAAACFLLCGLALLMESLRGPRWLVVACTGIVSVVSVLTIVEFVFSVNAGIDELLGPSYITVKLSSPGRMAPVSAICFAIGSIALLVAPKILSKRAALLLGLSGSIIAAAGMATCMSFALGSSDAFGWGGVTRVALHTAVGLWVLGFGILALAWHVETDQVGTPRWLPISMAIGIATATVGLWQALIAAGHAPFALLPAVVLGSGCLMAPIFGLTVYLAQRAHAQAAALRRSEAFLRQITAQARASERDLSLIIETIPGLVWCAAPDGELNYLNRRILDYTGTTPGAWAQLGWTNFLHPDVVEPTMRAWSRAVATGQLYENQCRLRRSDGVYRWFHMLGEAARDNEGGVTRWYGLLIDIDDRKNMEEALRSSETRLSRATQTAAVGEFAASIAHEINQPLAAVVTNGYACLRWLSAQPPGLAKAHEAAERIVRDGKEAGEVVQRIRALFKQAPLEKIELDLNEVIGEVLRLLGGETARRRVAVETDLGKDLGPVAGDRVQLQQLIFNLLLNGIEAMDSVVDHPKKLFIRSKRQNPETVLVEIQDCGVGLEDSEKVFEAFFTTKENGMGIGLAVCRSIIDAHHGRLWAASGDGAGATFSFTLPVQSSATS
jgi:hypothetical protein